MKTERDLVSPEQHIFSKSLPEPKGWLSQLKFRTLQADTCGHAIMMILARRRIPTMTNFHYDGSLSVMMVVGICKRQNKIIMMIMMINHFAAVMTLDGKQSQE